MVAQISTKEELIEYTSDSNKLTVIDFTAAWCPPCQAMAPVFETFVTQYPDVNFLKVDLTGGTKELAEFFSVTALPTFIFLVGSSEVAKSKIVGANLAALNSNITKFSTPASSGAFSSQGRSLSGEGQMLDRPMVKHEL